MPNYTHRVTKQYLRSISTVDLVEPEANYIKDSPEVEVLRAAGIEARYWNIAGDLVTEMSAAEKSVVDTAALELQRDVETAPLDASNTPDLLRALALVVRDEVNTLRAQHGLGARSIAQLKTALRNKM